MSKKVRPDLTNLTTDEKWLILELLRVLMREEDTVEMIVVGGGPENFTGLGAPWREQNNRRIHQTATLLVARNIMLGQCGKYRAEGYPLKGRRQGDIWYTFHPAFMRPGADFDRRLDRLVKILAPCMGNDVIHELLSFALRRSSSWLQSELW